MLQKQTVAVVVPAYNEETQIRRVIELMPEFVDLIVVINDKSKDRTSEVVQELMRDSKIMRPETLVRRSRKHSENPYDRAENVYLDALNEEDAYYIPAEVKESAKSRVVLINHLENGGVGAAIASGYKYCRDHGIDCTAVMAGDGQMDPAELESICMPVLTGRVDYCKGNRLKHKVASKVIPPIRFFGNSMLSILTKIASGYWRLSDTQTGYTAINLKALQAVSLYKIYKVYGMPNDLLVKLNILSMKISEIPIKPVYKMGEQSKMKIRVVVPKISFLLARLFVRRLTQKYLIRDFHPLFLLYGVSAFTALMDLPFIYRFVEHYISTSEVRYAHLMVITSLSLFSFQSFIFAMWFDMQDNERLYV